MGIIGYVTVIALGGNLREIYTIVIYQRFTLPIIVIPINFCAKQIYHNPRELMHHVHGDLHYRPGQQYIEIEFSAFPLLLECEFLRTYLY